MNDFLLTIVSFPTVFFTFWLGVAALYWLFAAFGLVDIEVFDVDLPDLDGQMTLNAQGEQTFAEIFAGILLRLGLNGVPVTIIITFLAVFGWLASYYLSYFAAAIFGYNWTRYVIGLPVIAASLYGAVLVTAQVIKPLRQFFSKAEQYTEKKILGQTAIVRSSKVDQRSGEVNFDDGGAGLIIKVRAMGDNQFVRGDRVVLLEYLAAENVYRVLSEAEFLGKSSE
jgi:hypothetical protein